MLLKGEGIARKKGDLIVKYHNVEMPDIHPEGCIAMTWEDATEMETKNSKCGYGYSAWDWLRIIATHMEFYYRVLEIGDEERKIPFIAEMERVEWMLGDANFHKVRGLLHDHKYGEVTKMVMNQFEDEFEGREI